MTWLVGSNLSVSAPALYGVNNQLNVVLWYWMQLVGGWTRTYNSTNHSIYRNASGDFLSVNHDSAVSGGARCAVVRGCESHSGATLTDTYPTVTQFADTSALWQVSTTDASTPRDYDIFLDENTVQLIVNPSGIANSIVAWRFYLPAGIAPSDAWAQSINTKGTVFSFGVTAATTIGLSTTAGREYSKRSADGSVKSVVAQISVGPEFMTWGAIGSTTSSIGDGSNMPAGRVPLRKISVWDTRSATTTIGAGTALRGWIKGLYGPQVNNIGKFNNRDETSNAVHSATTRFIAFRQLNIAAVFVENADTYVVPTG